MIKVFSKDHLKELLVKKEIHIATAVVYMEELNNSEDTKNKLERKDYTSNKNDYFFSYRSKVSSINSDIKEPEYTYTDSTIHQYTYTIGFFNSDTLACIYKDEYRDRHIEIPFFKEGEDVFILRDNSSAIVGKYISTELIFDRENTYSVEVKYHNRNRCYTTSPTDKIFSSKKDLYSSYLNELKVVPKSSVLSFGYIETILELFSLKYIIKNDSHGNISLPIKIDEVIRVIVDPYDPNSLYTIIAVSETGVHEVSESECFMSIQDISAIL